MVVALEVLALGVPVLALAYSLPSSGFAIKAIISILTPTATVGLIFVPKVLIAYDFALRQTGDSNPWRIVAKGSSSTNSSKKPAVRVSKDAIVAGTGTAMGTRLGAEPSSTHPTLATGAAAPAATVRGRAPPSLSSLVDDNFTFTRGPAKPAYKSFNTITPSVTGSSTPPKSEALTSVLDEDSMRRRLRRFLADQKADENVRFLDAVDAFRRDADAKRPVSARAIIQYFIIDTAPKQVNLRGETRERLVTPFKLDDRAALGSVTLFNAAVEEIYADLKNSDGFKKFLEQGGGDQRTAVNLNATGPSDASLT